MPLPDASADAVIASSSWHWVDPVPGLHEVGRVLVPGGVLGAVWSGPDRDAAFIAEAQALLSGGRGETGGSGAAESMLDEQSRAELSAAVNDPAATTQALEIPAGVPFDQPEHTVLTWDVALNAEELVGLLGTFSWVILMEDDARARLLDAARRALRDMLGVDGDATVDVGYRADVAGAASGLTSAFTRLRPARTRSLRGALRPIPNMSQWVRRCGRRRPPTFLRCSPSGDEAAEPTSTDSSEAVAVLLARDPGALIVAEADGEIVGSVVAGWDGWRGSVYRLAVAERYRRAGLGTGTAARRRVAPRRARCPPDACDRRRVERWGGPVLGGVRLGAPARPACVTPRGDASAFRSDLVRGIGAA